ncbi:MAG TPA: NADH-quinone oxidoreductase subunit NuoG [Baekduia sp.]|nr:NADH-quinone oxidoreductase subunit NuoG [Baekduia sp.]
MPRPEVKTISFTIDGREVQAPENMMLVDAAKLGDVEIPVFCYEPKLGAPVGACRMCLVEIEGIPKLQTGCSTPVKDGMVVNTQNERVQQAQEAIVEFLLINHPLDCPVCDKGGECPLQDISFGWGNGRSRFVEPKRHFEKPLALSPLIAIDRERCILCYRCVRFSQEVSEDYQLIFTERGAHTFVGTFDGHPYVAPFSGNIIELCPVGALTSQAYRFRARPWDIEQSGSVCTLCPGQCNVSYTVRDERVQRVLARQNDGVDDGWLCDKGRFAYQSIHVDERITKPMVRDGDELRETTWERALEEATNIFKRSKGSIGALAGRDSTNEDGYMIAALMRDALDSNNMDARARDASTMAETAARLDPALQASVTDIEYAHTVLLLGVEPVDEAPIIDLRIRKGVRRNRVNLIVATARPSSLDANAKLVARFAPGEEAHFVNSLIGGDSEVLAALKDGGEDVVIVYGERLLADPQGTAALLALADELGLRDRDGAGLLGIPAFTNTRGLTEVSFHPFHGDGLNTAQMRDAGLDALWLHGVDPLTELPDGAAWDKALGAAAVVAHARFLTDGVRAHAKVVFPLEAGAEKEGTVTHFDGRLQRVRSSIKHPDEVKPGWWVFSEIGKRLGHEFGVFASPMVSAEIFGRLPYYEGITLDTIGGTGVRWTEREQAASWPKGEVQAPQATTAMPAANGKLRLGTYRSVWAAPEVNASPALRFLTPDTKVELSPVDAERLKLVHGQRALVNGTEAKVVLRDAVPEGSAFIESNAVSDGLAEVKPA